MTMAGAQGGRGARLDARGKLASRPAARFDP